MDNQGTHQRKKVLAGFLSALFGTSCRLMIASAAIADNSGRTSFGDIMPTFEIYNTLIQTGLSPQLGNDSNDEERLVWEYVLDRCIIEGVSVRTCPSLS